MPRKLRLGYFAHSIRSDWNNGNAHFLRGLLRSLGVLGHNVTVYEPENEWSIDNLRSEANGVRALEQFIDVYSEFDLQTYAPGWAHDIWSERLRGMDIVILHEWTTTAMAQLLLGLREKLGYKLLFHDTHHRASSSPETMQLLGLEQFDGILAFGGALRDIYRDRFGIERVWTLHEAADTTVFKAHPKAAREDHIVWIGNWGDGERAIEIREFLLEPAAALRDIAHTSVYGVRYPGDGLEALARCGVSYMGYLPNLDAPEVYAGARVTVHIPRQQYTSAMKGIPTIRVFEALACAIPLVSAPWQDTERLFRSDDFCWAGSATEMEKALRFLITNRTAAEDQAARGLETVLARHTCDHRAQELTAICEEVLQ